jgi:hypothetical protein
VTLGGVIAAYGLVRQPFSLVAGHLLQDFRNNFLAVSTCDEVQVAGRIEQPVAKALSMQ